MLAPSAALSDADAPGPREKLIGTITTRPEPLKPDATQPDTPSRGQPSSGQPSSGLRQHERRYLNSAPGASHSADDRFRREAGDRIFFPAGSADIGLKGRGVLAAQAQWLNRYPAVRMTVEGHADDGGSPESNVALSAARAEAVRSRLIEEGVAARRIVVVARGRESRAAPCPDAHCQMQNRRAVVVVHATGAGEMIGLDGSAGDRPPGADRLRSGPVPR